MLDQLPGRTAVAAMDDAGAGFLPGLEPPLGAWRNVLHCAFAASSVECWASGSSFGVVAVLDRAGS